MQTDIIPETESTDQAETLGLEQLWAETLGDPTIRIAILDGPVDAAHPSLAGAALTQLETLVPATGIQQAAAVHGTHVASLIFGQHDGPIKGIAPRCTGLILPIFADALDGSIAPCSQLDLARAISQALQAGAHIINISGGEFTDSGTAHPLLADAVRDCADNGVLIVAAAGNEGCDCLHVPGALPSVLTVGAMDARGLPLEFSNWGDKYSLQGVLAPGQNILGAVPGGGTATRSGTSFAAPAVSGVAALLLSLQVKMGRALAAHAVRDAILESAYSCNPLAVADCRPFMVGSLNVSGAQALIERAPRGRVVAQSASGAQVDGAPGGDHLVPAEAPAILREGDLAPPFTARDQAGQAVSLADFRGRPVILWFYRHTDTPG